jgi:anhydro-N-acetylmuramic acid kinase
MLFGQFKVHMRLCCVNNIRNKKAAKVSKAHIFAVMTNLNLPKAHIRVLGLMSGTSMDGLDMCLVAFNGDPDAPEFKILSAETGPYPPPVLDMLKSMETAQGEQLIKLHLEYGKYLGIAAHDFLLSSGYQAHIVASHGHTIFHRPDLGYTFQAGHGQPIANHCKIPVVCDFRTADVFLGGQGAPLVPLADLILYKDFDACLNLGGFANITLNKNPPLAFDICPVNYVLNQHAAKLGFPYDPEGSLAAEGHVAEGLLKQLSELTYYRQMPPKSLGREWVEQHINPILAQLAPKDALALFTAHAAQQIAQALPKKGRVLITGGGAYNKYLIKLVKSYCPDTELVIPEPEIIEFKEAAVFAFLGWRKVLGKANIDGRITGSGKLHSSGVIYLPS